MRTSIASSPSTTSICSTSRAPDTAVPRYEAFVNAVRAQGIPTATGRFGAMMQVELVNDGPVTLIVETEGSKAV